MVNVLKFLTFYYFCLVIRAGNHIMSVRITNREDPYLLLLQKQSDLGLCWFLLSFACGLPLVDQWNFP